MSQKNEDPVKELISEDSFNYKLAYCSKRALKVCVTSFFVGIFGIPMVLKGFKLFKIPIEARLAVGLLSGLPIVYYTGKAARESCLEEVKDNFRYQ